MFQWKLLSLFLILLGHWGLQAQNPTEIIRNSENLLKGSNTYAEIEISIIRPKYTRTIQMKSWSKGEKYAMSLITAPAKDAGTVFLKRDKEVWNWVPGIERNIKLPPSMMSQSWMGTDMTNDDLVRQTSLTNDFTHTFLGMETIDGMECYKISLVPKPGTPVAWGKIVTWIEKTHYNQIKTQFFDEDNVLVNTFKGSELRKYGNKTLTSRLEMIPADKPGQKTVLIYQNLNLNMNLSDDFFTTQNMKKLR